MKEGINQLGSILSENSQEDEPQEKVVVPRGSYQPARAVPPAKEVKRVEEEEPEEEPEEDNFDDED